ncbi:MAG: helix-turn-helix domain-containing protein [Anaerolineaceae bacterium]|nr:MAG: helix-turn-helix domain-containing protein [Anaerolineaceae bacterium]
MNQVHPLTKKEISELKRLHRQTADADVRSRCDMILWSNEGLSPPQIPKRVRFSHDTVSRHIARYESEGINGLLTKPRSGRPRKVTADYEKRLLELVEQEPRNAGMHFSNWTTANLATELADQTGIEISPRQVENYLRQHDWHLRRPVRTVKHKQDPELVAEKKTDS